MISRVHFGLVAALTALALPATAAAQAPLLPEAPIPVHVVFDGTGTFDYDNSEGSHAVGDDQLNWDVEYQAELEPDGSLTAASGLPPTTAGNYTFTDDFYGVACSGPISTAPPPPEPGDPSPPPETTPAPSADGTLIQGLIYLSPNPAQYSNCIGTLGSYDGSGEVADGVATVLNQYLPGALTARVPAVPREAFLAGGVAQRVIPVSYADAPTRIPLSCADLFGIDDPSKCTIGLSWSGTVVLDATAGCPVILATPAPACMPASGTPLSAFTQGVETEATGPGTATMSASAGGALSSHAATAARQIVIASASTKVMHAGRVRLRPRLTAAGRRLLKRSRRLKVTVQIVFRPRSGLAHTTRFATVLNSAPAITRLG
jgi:hypothetical protein